jgi:hypothetical protein
MSIEDKLAIQKIIAQYSYTYDAQDAEGFANLFTEDAAWELIAAGAAHPAIRLETRATIHAWPSSACTRGGVGSSAVITNPVQCLRR